ncbi:MAG: hypothetical protein IPH97_00290 [Ignavibacteriales bacterium]|nr:hypothetical protein [Ignavibacteriales bacterium]
MKLPLFLIILVFLNELSLGQNEFIINDGSDIYDAKISVDKCSEDNCEGKGTIKLFDKKTDKLFQTFVSDDLYFFSDNSGNPTVNIIQLYNEQSPLIFEDFNFDGSEDLAIRNGNNSGYGGPSYDVYVYHRNKKKFVVSDELTQLAYENLGMFQTDHERKRIITFQKSGCCWHITTEYSVVPKKGLVKVFELEEDAQGGEFVIVTTRELINDKWISKEEIFKLDDYYKQE